MAWNLGIVEVERRAGPGSPDKNLVAVKADLSHNGAPAVAPGHTAVRVHVSDGSVTVIGQMKVAGKKPPRYVMNPKAVPANPVTVIVALVDANGQTLAEASGQFNPAI